MALRSLEDLPRVTEVFLFVDKMNRKSGVISISGLPDSVIRNSQLYTRKSNNKLTIFSFGSTLCGKLDFDCIPSWSLKTLAKNYLQSSQYKS